MALSAGMGNGLGWLRLNAPECCGFRLAAPAQWVYRSHVEKPVRFARAAFRFNRSISPARAGPFQNGGVEGEMPDRPSAKASIRNTNPAGASPSGLL
jgi:hypothetical protein